MDIIKSTYDIIIKNYVSIDDNISKVNHNMKKVENIYQTYINSKLIDSVNYSIYIDDIEHQVILTNIEYNYISNINFNNKIKLYRDLFKLYVRVNKTLLNIYNENKVMIIQIWTTNNIFQNETNSFRNMKKVIKKISEKYIDVVDESSIFESIKKYNFSLIYIFNELEEDKINFDVINNLFKELCNRINELYLTTELIKINLTDISFKTSCGITGYAYIADLAGKINKIKTDYKIILNLLKNIFFIHTTLSKKYFNISNDILNDINYEQKLSTTITNFTEDDIKSQNNDDIDDDIISSITKISDITSVSRINNKNNTEISTLL